MFPAVVIVVQIQFVKMAHTCQTGGQSHRRDDTNSLDKVFNKHMMPPKALKGLMSQLQCLIHM